MVPPGIAPPHEVIVAKSGNFEAQAGPGLALPEQLQPLTAGKHLHIFHISTKNILICMWLKHI
jgi:hypothetical protein